MVPGACTKMTRRVLAGCGGQGRVVRGTTQRSESRRMGSEPGVALATVGYPGSEPGVTHRPRGYPGNGRALAGRLLVRRRARGTHLRHSPSAPGSWSTRLLRRGGGTVRAVGECWTSGARVWAEGCPRPVVRAISVRETLVHVGGQITRSPQSYGACDRFSSYLCGAPTDATPSRARPLQPTRRRGFFCCTPSLFRADFCDPEPARPGPRSEDDRSLKAAEEYRDKRTTATDEQGRHS